MAADDPPKSLVQEYCEMITENLHETAWRLRYPINPPVGVDCFLTAFRRHGVDVEIREKDATFRTIVPAAGRMFSLEARMSFEEIARGWNGSVPASPGALYDSICEVYDRMRGCSSAINPDWYYHRRGSWEEQEALSLVRETQSREIRQHLKTELLPYFQKHQEHVLLPVSGGIPQLDEPRIFSRIVEKFPWTLLQQAQRLELGGIGMSCTPTAETLVMEYPSFDPGEFAASSMDLTADLDPCDTYHPSTSVLSDLFWGMYLLELTKEKGYQLRYDARSERRRLATLAECGWNALKTGHDLFPKIA